MISREWRARKASIEAQERGEPPPPPPLPTEPYLPPLPRNYRRRNKSPSIEKLLEGDEEPGVEQEKPLGRRARLKQERDEGLDEVKREQPRSDTKNSWKNRSREDPERGD